MNKDNNDVKPPEKLNDRQIKIAKAWMENEIGDRLPQSEFCKKHGLSTATLSKWKNENIHFQSYVQTLKGEAIPNDEVTAYHVIKRDILKRINSGNYTDAERDFYMNHFKHVIEYEKQKAMRELGINPDNPAGEDTRTVDEKKATLLSRLMN